jgi:hypothetical protein
VNEKQGRQLVYPQDLKEEVQEQKDVKDSLLEQWFPTQFSFLPT